MYYFHGGDIALSVSCSWKATQAGLDPPLGTPKYEINKKSGGDATILKRKKRLERLCGTHGYWHNFCLFRKVFG